MKSIRIRHLRLIGAEKNYDVDFMTKGAVRPVSVIAGEISTGKTSVLEFIAYGLGGSQHPRHQEILRQARSVLLEVELSEEVHVIERPLFSTEKTAFVHYCTIDGLGTPHPKLRKVIEPAGSSNSLSMFLLDHCGLAGISLQEAPTKPDSPTQPLSFRDVMWLSFLSNHRLDNKELLRERHFMENLKLRQVLEVLFGVHDDQLAKLGEALHKAEDDEASLQKELQSLDRFLSEQSVPEKAELEKQLDDIATQGRELDARLTEITQTMGARTAFAQEIRQKYSERSRAARETAAFIRDRETLSRRLIPLRSQYAEDEAKLVFYDEANALFDPLRVAVCPGCLQRLAEPVTVKDGACTLCGHAIQPTGEVIDVKNELRAVQSRRREIDRYIEQVEREIGEARLRYREAAEAEAKSQRQVDSEVAQTLSPFIAERDVLVREQEELRAREKAIQSYLGWRRGLMHRRVEFARLAERIKTLREEIRSRKTKRLSLEEVVSDLTGRFRSILTDFGFPKLNDPEAPNLGADFVPHVRGNVYRDIGSTGALTLISLAWYLAIFERSLSHGDPHPGFLMIDSPQKNLRPEQDRKADEFQKQAIVERVWCRLLATSKSGASGGQLIIVDNRPPEQARTTIVVEYSGDPNRPPYGLIDNETH